MCLGVQGRIPEIESGSSLRATKTGFDGAMRRVDVTHVPEAGIGHCCTVHAGFAMGLLSESEAHEQLSMLHSIVSLDRRTPEPGGGPPLQLPVSALRLYT